MDPTLKQLNADLNSAVEALNSAIKAGDLENAEKAGNSVDEIKAKIDDRAAQLKKLENFQKKANDALAFASTPVFTVPVPGGKKFEARIETGDSEIDKYADDGGFKNVGHLTYALRTAGSDGASAASIKKWQDVQIKAPQGMFEEADPDGGILVPRQFSQTMYQRLMNTNSLFSRLSPFTVSGNNLTIPALKEDSRANGSRHGGVQAYWDGEADQYTASRPKFRKLDMKLHKLTVLTYMTEEFVRDSATAMESFLNQVVPREIDFKIGDALVNGNGVGMPLGFLSSGSKITVTAESGQGAGTIVYKNIVKMWNRLLASARGNSAWLINQDVEPQLEQLYLATGTAHGNPIYLPAGTGQWAADLSRLKGRPVVPIEQCATLGTEGDIILVSFDGIASIVKGTGVESAMSMHLRFDYQELAYRWSFRMDAQPYDNVALTPFKGSTTTSHIVTLNSSRT